MEHLSQDIINSFIPVGSISAFSRGYYVNSSNGGFAIVPPGSNSPSGANSMMPSEWRVCDGSALNDPESPIFNGGGRYLPNLTGDRFLASRTSIGTVDGTNSATHASHTAVGGPDWSTNYHTHDSGSIWARIGLQTEAEWGVIFYSATTTGSPYTRTAEFRHLEYYFPVVGAYQISWVQNGALPAVYTGATATTGNTSSPNVGSLNHTHGTVTSQSIDNRPKYLGHFYIMKVK